MQQQQQQQREEGGVGGGSWHCSSGGEYSKVCYNTHSRPQTHTFARTTYLTTNPTNIPRTKTPHKIGHKLTLNLCSAVHQVCRILLGLWRLHPHLWLSRVAYRQCLSVCIYMWVCWTHTWSETCFVVILSTPGKFCFCSNSSAPFPSIAMAFAISYVDIEVKLKGQLTNLLYSKESFFVQ